jgi:hypothetical protein
MKIGGLAVANVIDEVDVLPEVLRVALVHAVEEDFQAGGSCPGRLSAKGAGKKKQAENENAPIGNCSR